MTLKDRNPLVSKVTLTLLAFLTLEGCQVPDKNEIPMPDKPYELKHDTKPFTIEFGSHSSKLSEAEKERLLTALKAHGPGKVSVHITLPTKGSRLQKQRLKNIIRAILESGVKAKRIHRSNNLPSATESSVTVLLDTYRAIPPLCPNWSTTFGKVYDRGPTSNFGCATAVNFLLMIEDPIVLFKAEPALSRDAARDSLSIADHRLGKDKGKWLKVETNSTGSSGSSGSSGTAGGGGPQ